MKGIFLVLIFLIIGVFVGLVMGVFLPRIQEYYLRKKISKKARESKKNFFYKEKIYDIKQEIEKQLVDFNTMRMNRRKKKMKGGNKKNGNTLQSRSEGIGNQGTDEGVKQAEGSSSDSRSDTGDSRSDTGQVTNRNLLKRGRKFN